MSRLTKVFFDYRALLERKAGRQISVICEKTIVGDIARFLAWFWPKSKTVILVRDLRDMLCSFVAFDQKRGFSSFSAGIEQDPATYFSRLSLYVSQLQNMGYDNPSSTLIVRYEDLVLHPRACLNQILEFCEIEAGSDAVDRCLAETPGAGDFHKTHATSPNARSSIGRWRQDLPPEAQDYYETHLRSVNTYFGYA